MKEKKESKLINFRPLCVGALCLILGIVCAYFTIASSPLVTAGFVAVIVLGIFICGFYPFKNKLKSVVYLLVAIIIFTAGYFSVDIRYSIAQNQTEWNEQGYFRGRVTKCDIYESGYLLELDDCSLNDEKIKGKTISFISTYDYYGMPEIGDVIYCEAKIERNNQDKDKLYNYIGGKFFKVNVKSKVQLIDTKLDFFEFYFLKFRQFFLNNMSEETAPFAIALMTGDTSRLSESRLEVFRMAGIAHVFAVSGLHIGLFVTALFFIAKKFKLGRWTTIILVLVPSFIYTGLCGFRPSALRAFIMASVMLIAWATGFKNDPLSSCAIAGLIILLINPMSLFDVGFRLSFVAVTSLLTLAPLLSRGLKPLGFMAKPLAVSISCQLGTLPILTDMSGYMSIISVFANIIFVPLVSLAFVFLFVFSILGMIESAIFTTATVTMFLPQSLLFFIDKAVNFVNYSKFIVPVNFGTIRAVWYIGLFALCDMLNISKKQKMAVVLTALTVSVLFALFV